MRIKCARIRHFRSVREVAIQFGSLTLLIGGNGSGKSTILKAIELFYTPGNPPITIEDFFHQDTSTPIEIELTFCDLNEGERAAFAKRVAANGEMSVTRVFEFYGGRVTGTYHGVAHRNPDFEGARLASGKREKVAEYRMLRAGAYPELPQTVSTGDAVEPALAAWEDEHPDRCVPHRDDGQFFGFQQVAQGKLRSATQCVVIPAVRDASEDAAEGRGSPISELMDLVVRSAIESKPEIKELRRLVDRELAKATDPSNVPELAELSDSLSLNLRQYYPDCSVHIAWKPREEVSVPIPSALVQLDDDGVLSPVDRTGHGLQRSFIMALLQRLAAASYQRPSEQEDDSGLGLAVPSLVLGIEEPELFQHPTKQRHIANVLRRLAAGSLPGSRDTQIICSTHSPLFIDVGRFDEIRIVRRSPTEDGAPREALVAALSLDAICHRLEAAWNEEPGAFTPATLRPRLHIVDSSVAEGFFARAVILVEGASDRAALLGAAQQRGVDLGSREIALLVTSGKRNIDRIAVIFQGLGIPTYAVWDCDEGADDPHNVPCNRALQVIFGVADSDIADCCDRIADNHACFRTKLEDALRKEIGANLYDEVLAAVQREYGISRKEALKTPDVMQEFLARVAIRGAEPRLLFAIIDAALAWQPAHAEPRQLELSPAHCTVLVDRPTPPP